MPSGAEGMIAGTFFHVQRKEWDIVDNIIKTSGEVFWNAKKLHIAILGSRCISNNYIGCERFAENLAVRLVRRGKGISNYVGYKRQLFIKS